MYLAGILGLCALLPFPNAAQGGSRASFLQSESQTPQAPAQAPPQPANTVQTPSAKPDASATPPATAKKPAKKRRKKTSDSSQGSKTVVRKGGTGDKTPQLTPAVNEADISKQRETTKQLLSATDVNLQKLSARSLSKEEQDTIAQIHEFMDQAKTADSKGDLERASKLAAKAHMLSEALANP